MKYAACYVLCILFLCTQAIAGAISTLEDVPLNARSDYYNGTNAAPSAAGDPRSSDFFSGGFFYHGIISPYGDGWVGSNHTDTTNYQPNPSLHQYDAITGRGGNNSPTYAVSYDSGGVRIDLPAGQHPFSAQFTNNTYAYYSMLNSDQFAKTFGPGDWFKVTVSGLDANAQPVGTPVDVYLADFRSPDPAADYILNTWKTADLTPLGNASSLLFSLSSSDASTFEGQTFMNTPSYFAMDNLTSVPEPSIMLGFLALLFISFERRTCKLSRIIHHGDTEARRRSRNFKRHLQL